MSRLFEAMLYPIISGGLSTTTDARGFFTPGIIARGLGLWRRPPLPLFYLFAMYIRSAMLVPGIISVAILPRSSALFVTLSVFPSSREAVKN